MIVDKQIEVAKILLSTNLLKQVYVDVELLQNDKGVKYPVYKTGNEQFYIGPDDTKDLFGYIRQTTPVNTIAEKNEGSCKKLYKLGIPSRIVVFKDHEERDFDTLISQLLKPIFSSFTSLISINRNAFQLAQQESPIGDFAFDATTFYCAIDVMLSTWISDTICEVNNCLIYQNPVCV